MGASDTTIDRSVVRCRSMWRSWQPAIASFATLLALAAVGGSPAVEAAKNTSEETVYWMGPGGSERPAGSIDHWAFVARGRREGYSFTTDSLITGARWESWGGPTATATATASFQFYDNRVPGSVGVYGKAEDVPVRLIAERRRRCGGRLFYMGYSLELLTPEDRPRYFDRLRRVRYRCEIRAGYSRPALRTPALRRAGSCSLAGFGDVANPHGPPGGAVGGSICRIRWSAWGRSRVVGTGVLRRDAPFDAPRTYSPWDYGARIVLSGLTFCRQFKMSYSRAHTTVYGEGLPNTAAGPVPAATTRRLLADVGRRGIRVRHFRTALPRSSGCEPIAGGRASDRAR